MLVGDYPLQSQFSESQKQHYHNHELFSRSRNFFVSFREPLLQLSSQCGVIVTMTENSLPEEVVAEATRDIADVAAVEVITTACVHLLSAAAVKVGLADDPENQIDLDEARKLINALAGLITAAAPEVSDMHARSLRDGLRSVQLAFREASTIPDAPGAGPGEKWTGSVI